MLPPMLGVDCLHWPLLYMVTLLISLNLTAAGPRYSSRIVETKTGAIRGVILELNSRHLEPVEVFKTVPYAAPPVGQLRFEAPQKLPPWKGTKLADTFGPVCPQNFPDINNRTSALLGMPKGRYQYLRKLVPHLVNQHEDCLTLNIYVPGSGNRGLEAPYSVLFYIHGESFEWGSGNPYDGSVLASYGHVVVITVNFRLGILGFLKTRASDSPGSGGNLALMDIVAALQWTKNNIAAFGGDPSRVIIVGHDYGAALANLVLVSKAGRGLFHRTILLSGSALSPWAIIRDPDTMREEVSQQMACHLNSDSVEATTKPYSTDDITDCLKSKPLEALMGIRLPSVRFMSSWGPILPLDDAPDPEYAMGHTGQNFITTELMIGMTTTESYNDFSDSDIQFGMEDDHRNRILRTYIRNAFSFHLNEIFSAVRNEYTDWDKPIQHPINIRDSTMEALSDGHTISPLIKTAYLHARRGAKTYLFHFSYQSKDSEYPQRLGSVRGEDLPYVFGLPLVHGMPFFAQNYSKQDMGVAEAMLNFMTNFCKSGNPNDAGHQQAMLHADYGTARERTRYQGINWGTYEITTQQYLSISSKPKMKSHYRGHKMAVWLNLIPQLHRPGDPEISMRHHHFPDREQRYYAGNVRPELFIHPKTLLKNAAAKKDFNQDSFNSDCTPDPTMGEVLQEAEDTVMLEDEADELLQKLAARNYYSYTTALGVTIGVGCLLLVLNMLIFAGIYYQKDRSRRRTRNKAINHYSDPCHRGSGDDMPMTTRPKSSMPNNIQQDPPPNYTTLQKSPCVHKSNRGNCDMYKQQNIQSDPCQTHVIAVCPNQPTKLQHTSSGMKITTKTAPPMPPQRSSSSLQSTVPALRNAAEDHRQVMQEAAAAAAAAQHSRHSHQQQQQQQQQRPAMAGCNSGTNNYTSTLKKRVQIQEVTV